MNIIQEIFATLKQNKLRTILTGLSVSWGIFILIVLLGAGNGLRNGVSSNFTDRATNSVQIYSGRASVPYKGLKTNRSLDFTEQQLAIIKNEIPEADKKTGLIEQYNVVISYNNEYGEYTLMGVEPDYEAVFNLRIPENSGRFLNEIDIKQQNKIIILDKRVENLLFKGESALGKYVKVGSIMFRVVGVNTREDNWNSGNVYIPFSTAMTIYKPNKKFYSIAFTVKGLETEKANEEFNTRLKTTMSKSLLFDPDDPQGMWIWNEQKNYIQTQKIFGGINIFLMIIGVFTLIAGVVGISNIMLVSVKERTREFGIRKAIGAPPSSILLSVIAESILITTVFGYIGLMLGVGLTELVAYVLDMNQDPSGMSIFKNPTINLGYAMICTGIMVLAGVIAGYIPAKRAVSIKPIEAMREE